MKGEDIFTPIIVVDDNEPPTVLVNYSIIDIHESGPCTIRGVYTNNSKNTNRKKGLIY